MKSEGKKYAGLHSKYFRVQIIFAYPFGFEARSGFGAVPFLLLLLEVFRLNFLKTLKIFVSSPGVFHHLDGRNGMSIQELPCSRKQNCLPKSPWFSTGLFFTRL